MGHYLMQYYPKILIHIKTNSFTHLATNFSKMFSFSKQSLRNLLLFCPRKIIQKICEINQHWIGNYPMHCCPKRLSFLKTNFFLHLPYLLLKIFFDLKVKLKILSLFLSLKDITEYAFNQYWIGKNPMQCCPNRLIYSKALSWELFL